MGAHRVANEERDRLANRLEAQSQAVERARAEAEVRSEELERLRGSLAEEANQVRAEAATEMAAARQAAEAAQATAGEAGQQLDQLQARLSAAEERAAAAAEELEGNRRQLGQLSSEQERRTAEITQLKRRALRAEREAEEAGKARDRALEEKRALKQERAKARRSGGERRQPRERPARERSAREPAVRPVRKAEPEPEVRVERATPPPLGPSFSDRLETARQEEAAARAEVERLTQAADGNGEPSVERVDAEAELERAGGELANLEHSLELTLERVERTARSQLKRSTRGALKEATTRLAGTLVEGEEIRYMAAGGQRDGRQLIAATDRRLLVVDTTEAPPRAVEYENVESAEVGRRGTLEVSTASGDLTLEYVVGDLAGLVQHVNQRIWDVLHSEG
jgi:hypothetical protein